MKGGAKQEQSPSKPRNHTNGDAVQNYSPSKFPHNTTSPDNSPCKYILWLLLVFFLVPVATNSLQCFM